MEYLLQLQWADPVAKGVARVLSTLPGGVEQTTAAVPGTTNGGFTLLRADDRLALEKIAQAIAAAGADVRIVAKDVA